ncbi:hypothetical protein HDV00_008926 [Rhizophlyctis rosea]|nr:hypothetical protein HDV00_008926 [Rhizophlyctis rosea]
MTVLHLWILFARLRAEGPDGRDMKQEVFTHIWLDVEIKLHKAGVKSRLNKILTDLMSAYYGQVLAYDEGLYHEGDAILAAALWRNVFGANKPANATDLELLLTYVRRQLQQAEQIDRDEILGGKFAFADVELRQTADGSSTIV